MKGQSVRYFLALALCVVLGCVSSVVAKTVRVTPGVAPSGNCATPQPTINDGIRCLVSGDTLNIDPMPDGGFYDELIVGEGPGSNFAESVKRQMASVQPNVAVIPNGLDAGRPTVLRKTPGVAGQVKIRIARGKGFPGGGGAITMVAAKYVTFDGLRIYQNGDPHRASGAVLQESQYITIRNAYLEGTIYAGPLARGIVVEQTEVAHTGRGFCEFPSQKTMPNGQPCPHGLYLCGTDNVVRNNLVHENGYYGIQLSCEQGGLARNTVLDNVVYNNPGVGIYVNSKDFLVAGNLVINNGRGIDVSGSGTARNNTVLGYDPRVTDRYAMQVRGATRAFNNIIQGQHGAWYIAVRRAGSSLVPADPGQVFSNLCDEAGVGCLILSPDATFIDSTYDENTRRFTFNPATNRWGDFRLKAGSPAWTAGVQQSLDVPDRFGVPFGGSRAVGAFVAPGDAPPPAPVSPSVPPSAPTPAVAVSPAPLQTPTAPVESPPISPALPATEMPAQVTLEWCISFPDVPGAGRGCIHVQVDPGKPMVPQLSHCVRDLQTPDTPCMP